MVILCLIKELRRVGMIASLGTKIFSPFEVPGKHIRNRLINNNAVFLKLILSPQPFIYMLLWAQIPKLKKYQKMPIY